MIKGEFTDLLIVLPQRSPYKGHIGLLQLLHVDLGHSRGGGEICFLEECLT